MAALIITVPLTLSYLGEERFGVWMTVASLAGLLTFLDLGVGNGFISHVAKANVTGGAEKFRCTVTRGLILLALIGIVVGMLLSMLNTWIPFESIISVETEQATEDARESAWIFIGLFSLGIPLNGIYQIFQGLQKSWVVHSLKSFGSIISILAVVILSAKKADPASLLLATYGVQTVLPAILLIYIARQNWLTTHPHLQPKESLLEYRHLIGAGGLFFVLQIGTMVGWGADTLILSSLAGAAAVAQFAVAQRMYQLVSVPLSIMNAPLWSAYADAKAHGDKEFIEKTLKKSLFGTLGISALLSVTLFMLSGAILNLWVGDAVQVSESLLLGFMIWTVMQASGNSFAMFLNGMHIIKPQVVAVMCFVALVLPLKIYFVPEFGAVAIIWSTVLAYFIAVVLFYGFRFRRLVDIGPGSQVA